MQLVLLCRTQRLRSAMGTARRHQSSTIIKGERSECSTVLTQPRCPCLPAMAARRAAIHSRGSRPAAPAASRGLARTHSRPTCG